MRVLGDLRSECRAILLHVRRSRPVWTKRKWKDAVNAVSRDKRWGVVAHGGLRVSAKSKERAFSIQPIFAKRPQDEGPVAEKAPSAKTQRTAQTLLRSEAELLPPVMHEGPCSEDAQKHSQTLLCGHAAVEEHGAPAWRTLSSGACDPSVAEVRSNLSAHRFDDFCFASMLLLFLFEQMSRHMSKCFCCSRRLL